MNALIVAAIGCAAGVIGTGAGGVITCLLGRPSNRVLSVYLGFAAGIMLAVVAFDLMPEAFETGGLWLAVGGLLMGVILLAMVDGLAPHVHAFSEDRESSRFVRTGVLIGLGVAMHNFPEGMAIGSGYAHTGSFGILLAILMSLHNVPEGMAISAPFCLARMGRRRIVLWTALAGLPMGVGALAGLVLGAVSSAFLSVSLGFAAGAMLFITCDELIPAASEIAVGHSATWGIVAGMLLGIFISYGLHH
ncbi:MAG: ZIP family metal transporter [Bacillota bacterium]